jgi:integration host factor subunit alpha
MTLKKADLIRSVAEIGYSRKKSATIVESMLEAIKATLESGEDLLISRFGKFCITKKRKNKDGHFRHNSSIYFKCSPTLLNKINRSG